MVIVPMCPECKGEMKNRPPDYVCTVCGLAVNRFQIDRARARAKQEEEKNIVLTEEEKREEKKKRQRDYADDLERVEKKKTRRW